MRADRKRLDMDSGSPAEINFAFMGNDDCWCVAQRDRECGWKRAIYSSEYPLIWLTARLMCWIFQECFGCWRNEWKFWTLLILSFGGRNCRWKHNIIKVQTTLMGLCLFGLILWMWFYLQCHFHVCISCKHIFVLRCLLLFVCSPTLSPYRSCWLWWPTCCCSAIIPWDKVSQF